MSGGDRVRGDQVCSAHAEVIPSRSWHTARPVRLLRTRGGDPAVIETVSPIDMSAPHTRR